MAKTRAFQQLLSCFFPRRCSRVEVTMEEMEVNTQEEEEEEEEEEDSHVSMSRLPDNIIFDVLSRLPVKSLGRFRCVSKAWRDLISDPAFVAAQSSHAASALRPLVVGVFGKPCPLEKFYPSRPPRHFLQASLELRVMDTADGGSILRVFKDIKSTKLTLARLDLLFLDHGMHGGRVIDPANGRVVTIGRHGFNEYPRADYSGIRYIGVKRWSCHSSFGRASQSGVYKAVHIADALAEYGKSQIFRVATIGDDDAPLVWRQRPEPPIFTCCCASCAATVDGILYFLDRDAPAHGNLPLGDGPQDWNHIAAFDLESEEWKTMINGPPIGSPGVDERWGMALAELKGTLCVVQIVVRSSRYGGDRCANIWSLLDSESSVWVKDYTIQMPRSCRVFKPLEISSDGRIFMLNTFKKDEEYVRDARCILQTYDPRTGAFVELMEMGKDFRGQMTLYTGRLLS